MSLQVPLLESYQEVHSVETDFGCRRVFVTPKIYSSQCSFYVYFHALLTESFQAFCLRFGSLIFIFAGLKKSLYLSLKNVFKGERISVKIFFNI